MRPFALSEAKVKSVRWLSGTYIPKPVRFLTFLTFLTLFAPVFVISCKIHIIHDVGPKKKRPLGPTLLWGQILSF